MCPQTAAKLYADFQLWWSSSLTLGCAVSLFDMWITWMAEQTYNRTQHIGSREAQANIEIHKLISNVIKYEIRDQFWMKNNIFISMSIYGMRARERRVQNIHKFPYDFEQSFHILVFIALWMCLSTWMNKQQQARWWIFELISQCRYCAILLNNNTNPQSNYTLCEHRLLSDCSRR